MSRTLTRILVGASRGLPTSELPVVVVQGPPGSPVAAITANLHGDECTGIGVVHALDAYLAAHPPKGTVVMYPSCNPQGLAGQSRMVPADDADLNRAFPGDARGSLSGRIASALWRDLTSRGVSLVIDLHADSGASIPYVIVDRPVRLTGKARGSLGATILSYAAGSGLTVLREYPDDVYVQFGLDRSLAGAVVNEIKVPAVTIEAGPRRSLDPVAVAVGLEATLGVLTAAGFVDATATRHPSALDGTWRRASSPRARRAGVLQPLVTPGSTFERGDAMARILSLDGAVEEEVRAPAAGVLVSWVDGCWVPAGGVLGTLGVPDRDRL